MAKAEVRNNRSKFIIYRCQFYFNDNYIAFKVGGKTNKNVHSLLYVYITKKKMFAIIFYVRFITVNDIFDAHTHNVEVYRTLSL